MMPRIGELLSLLFIYRRVSINGSKLVTSACFVVTDVWWSWVRRCKLIQSGNCELSVSISSIIHLDISIPRPPSPSLMTVVPCSPTTLEKRFPSECCSSFGSSSTCNGSDDSAIGMKTWPWWVSSDKVAKTCSISDDSKKSFVAETVNHVLSNALYSLWWMFLQCDQIEYVKCSGGSKGSYEELSIAEEISFAQFDQNNRHRAEEWSCVCQCVRVEISAFRHWINPVRYIDVLPRKWRSLLRPWIGVFHWSEIEGNQSSVIDEDSDLQQGIFEHCLRNDWKITNDDRVCQVERFVSGQREIDQFNLQAFPEETLADSSSKLTLMIAKDQPTVVVLFRPLTEKFHQWKA